MYDVRLAPMLIEKIAFRAADEPILMRESSVVTTSEMRTAFSGMSQPGRT